MRLFRRASPPAPVVPETAPQRRRHTGRFDGLTEEWRISAEIEIEGRLADVLNRRESMPISEVLWGPADGSAPLLPASSIKIMDPYDLLIAMAGEGCSPVLTDAEREALRVHRTSYDVIIDVEPYTVTGTVHLQPGTEPSRLLDRGNDLFVAVTNAAVYLGQTELDMDGVDVVLVNRSCLRGIHQADARPPM